MSFLHDYTFSDELLRKDGISVSAADLYGMLLGLISGGVKRTDKEFKSYIVNLVNDGEEINSNAWDWINQEAIYIVGQFLQGEGLKLLLPNDDTNLEERLVAFTELINSFLVGFSCKQKLQNKLSHDIREFLSDLTEISRIDTSVSAPEVLESMEADFMILTEHVSVGIQICFEECAAKQYPKPEQDFIIDDEADDCRPVELSEERKSVHAMEEQFWEKQTKLRVSEKVFKK